MSVTRLQKNSLLLLILLTMVFSCGNRTVISSKKAVGDVRRKNTTIEWLTETTHDFGVYTEREVKQFDFVYRNTGDHAFIIDSVLTSCGCTYAVYGKQPVSPGKTDTVHVYYSGNGFLPGYFHQQCIVLGNISQPAILVISGIFDHVE